MIVPPSPQGDDAPTRAIAASAYSILDVSTRRVIDEQRGDWLDAPVWPGSIAKLATYTAAIEAGTLSPSTHIICTRRVTLRDGRRVDCSHPPIASALSLREAVAMSCNVFAAEVARHMSASQLAAGFARVGLPSPPSTVGDQTAIALGLGGTQMPPRRLLAALMRVVNQADASAGAAASAGSAGGARNAGSGGERAAARALLLEGLRDSARSGTASAFGRAGLDAFAKTGTALMPNGRSLGLVVALAPATSPRLGIIVALPGGAGADAADVAASLLQRRLAQPSPHANAAPKADVAPAVIASASAIAAGAPQPMPRPASSDDDVRLRIGTPTIGTPGYRVEQLSLEDYVARVVAGETSSATPPAAREALAITARTYALANRGRHAADGFDLCTLTHCQVLRPTTAASRDAAFRTRRRTLARDAAPPNAAAAPAASAPAKAAATATTATTATTAAAATAAAPPQVFYSAACGGQLDDASTLLPDTKPGAIAWMTSRPDPAGVAEPTWHADLSAADLMKALRASGVRGEVLRDLSVRTSTTGRALTMTLAGLTPSTLDADDFRRIIGQQLGWQWLKSPRFTASRTARGYRFDGRGHGHGVGLCLFGASAFATRGKTADEILKIYFPGLHATSAQDEIELRLPASDERERASLRSSIEQDLRELRAALALDPRAPAHVSVIVHPTVDSFRRATGRRWWTSAATTFDASRSVATIHIVPLGGLRRSGRLDITIRHEIVHVLTEATLHARPLWVREGVAAHFAGERFGSAGAEAKTCPADTEFTRPPNGAAFQQVYARAATCVAREIGHGVPWREIGR